MFHIVKILCVGLFLNTFLIGQTRYAAKNRDAENFLREKMRELRIPGLQAVIIFHGKPVLVRSYGTANIENLTPVTSQTVFPVHSMTKAFTGVAVMQLVEEGKLSLDSPISKYLSDLPAAWQTITVRQLLTHTSGLPDLWDNTPKLIADSEAAAWEKVRVMPMQSVPGAQFKYVQTNYALIGKIIDKLSGMPFAEFIRKNQFDTVGMPNTGFGDSHTVAPHISGTYCFQTAGGVSRPTDPIQNCVLDWLPFIRTAAGVNTNARDLSRWLLALRDGKLIKKTSLETLWTPGVLNDGRIEGFSNLINGYAIGWPIVRRSEHPAMVSTGGGRASLYFYPKDDLVIIILTNLLGASPDSFTDELAGCYIPSMKAANAFGFPPAIKMLRDEFARRGYQNPLEAVNDLKKKDPTFELVENDLNNWGYALLNAKKVNESLAVFKLNTALFPRSWNVYDSYGEGLLKTGRKTEALEMYRKSVELNPDNESGKKILREFQKPE